MNKANKHERAVCVHEAAHVFACYINNFDFKETHIRRLPNGLTQAIGSFKCPPFPEKWDTDEEATQELKLLFYKLIFLFSSGYLAQYMYSGDRQFWEHNDKAVFLLPKPNSDGNALREIASTLPKKEFKRILGIVADYIAESKHFGEIVAVAEELQEYKKIIGFPGVLENDRSEPVSPEHDATNLINMIVERLYGKDYTK
jgi:hypothetical protein